MAKQTFTAGQVLTATQMNNLQANDYNWTTSAQTASYVLVAANAGQTVTMTNASATTITVNTGLFAAGDTVRILNLGAGACTITAGTATVNSAGSLVLPQYGSGTLWFSSASAAIFIPDDRNSGWVTITTTSVSAVSAANFNNVFTSTYENYRIIINAQNSAAASLLSMRLRVGGSDNSTANYAYIGSGYNTANALDNSNAEGATSWEVGYCDTASIGFYSDFMIYNPQIALRTTMFGASMKGISATRLANRFYGCLFNATTQFDGFTLTPSLGTITGKITVLGQVQ